MKYAKVYGGELSDCLTEPPGFSHGEHQYESFVEQEITPEDEEHAVIIKELLLSVFNN